MARHKSCALPWSFSSPDGPPSCGHGHTEWRYSVVAHKMIAQESGHLCQNLYLASEAMDAGACALTYDQALVDRILGVDGVDEFAIYVAPVGKVASARYHFDH